jgi:hypothetical protein
MARVGEVSRLVKTTGNAALTDLADDATPIFLELSNKSESLADNIRLFAVGLCAGGLMKRADTEENVRLGQRAPPLRTMLAPGMYSRRAHVA